MKDTLREDIKKLVGGKLDNSNYMAMAYKGFAFNISDGKRSFDVSLEGYVEAIDPKGSAVANPEQYATYLNSDKIAHLHHEKVALFHVRESGSAYPAEIFDTLADVFVWAKA
jgi:hypothetical protein